MTEWCISSSISAADSRSISVVTVIRTDAVSLAVLHITDGAVLTPVSSAFVSSCSWHCYCRTVYTHTHTDDPGKLDVSPPRRFLLFQLKPEHHCLDVFNYSCHSVHMSCWIKNLLTYLLSRERNVLGAKRPGANWQRGETSTNHDPLYTVGLIKVGELTPTCFDFVPLPAQCFSVYNTHHNSTKISYYDAWFVDFNWFIFVYLCLNSYR